MSVSDERGHEMLFDQIHRFTWKSWLLIAILGSLTGLWFYVWGFQVIQNGLSVTGMNRPAYWGVFIMSFVYFIGLSHAGTLVSAILRVTNAEWRRPLTRIAESITVFVLIIGFSMVLWDVGRPVRALLYIPLHGRFQSPLVWDFAAISTYLTMSVAFLYVAMIPDLAHLRDRVSARWRWIYELLALNFRGTKDDWEQYEKAMFLLSVAVIPVAVSVHTVVSFIFSMEPKPMWHETAFGPFFVTGALFSGVAAIVVAVALFRKYYDLRDYLTPSLFDKLGKLLLALSMIWMYFIVIEHLTTFYESEHVEMAVLLTRVVGEFSPMFLAMLALNFVIPFPLLVFRRTIRTTTFASLCILAGMYMERYLIVAPTLTTPRTPLVEPLTYNLATYVPTWQEGVSLLGGYAFFILMYFLFTKFFPVVPYSEVREEEHLALENGDTDTDLGYTDPRSSRGMSWLQKLIVAGFALHVSVILAILVKLTYNGYLFGFVLGEIQDASFYYALGANAFYMPALAITLVAVTRLGLHLTRKNRR